nr:enniatin synthase [Quercus suber]
MPLNANGKVDRRELTRRAKVVSRAEVTTDRVSPRNEVEAVLCEEFAEVLGIEVGITDNFFDLGGHSLMATKLAARTSRRLDARVSVKDVFDNPVLADLAVVIQRGSTPHKPIPASIYTGPVEQSYAQGRLWFLDRLNLGLTSYLQSLAIHLRGPLNRTALNTALLALEQRHETLRTVFKEQDGIGMQVVLPKRDHVLDIIDLPTAHEGGYTEVLQAEQATPFDLTHEPGWRVSLLCLGDQSCILSIVLHHIISDGWSLDVLRRELSVFYTAAVGGQDPLAQVDALPIQYRDFALWQKQPEQVEEHQRQLEYWVTQLADSSPAEFLTDLPRPPALSGQAGTVHLSIDGHVYEQLRAFCRVHQTTAFAVLLAVFRATHYRLTGAEDATIGTPIANRNRPELDSMIGFFVNAQCMRIEVGENDTFTSLIRHVRSTATAAFANQDVPFERIVSRLLSGSRDTSRNPLVQLMFALHSQQDLGKIHLEGLESEPVHRDASTRFDVEFHLLQDEGKLGGVVYYATDLFKPETITGMVAVFQEMLRRALEQPETPIAVVPLSDGLADLRAMGLLEIKNTKYPRDSSVIDIFLEQVAAFPDVMAVKDPSSQFTYAQLNYLSDLLATWLCHRNIPAESPVGVLAPRSCQAIIAFLGILKANLAYLPLDINVPVTRIDSILSTLQGPRLVLLGSTIPTPGSQLDNAEFIPIGDTLKHLQSKDSVPASTKPFANSLAYVIFTSGSTGMPKGVMIEHRSIVRLVKNSNIVAKLPTAPRIPHMLNLAFDASGLEIYSALLNGGTLVCVDYETVLDSDALKAVFAREQLCAALVSPGILKQLLNDVPSMFSALNIVVVGGARLDSSDARSAQALVPGGVYNAYGPSENAVISTIYNVAEDELFVHGVPIGTGMSNSGAYVMDSLQQLVPLGVMGELVVTGDGLARGYTNSKLNHERFIEITIDGSTVRAFRTGDRVRYRRTDGQLEFFGRMDQQIKIRGHRVEPAEVEHAILSHSTVRDAAVITRNSKEHESELVAFCIVQAHHKAQSHESREARLLELKLQIINRLKSSLPAYMVPAQIIVLDQMPFTTNGKIDTKELARKAQVEPRNNAAVQYAAPRTDLEKIVCEEFAHVLGIEVGITDNFFDLGGHSLLANKLAARISHRLDFRISVKDIFEEPKPVDLAVVLLSKVTGDQAVTIEDSAPFKLLPFQDPQDFVDHNILPQLKDRPGRIVDVYPATWLQKHFLCDPVTGTPRTPSLFYFDFPADASTTELIRACKDLIEMYEIFRTVFVFVAGIYYQVVLDRLEIPIKVLQVEHDIPLATSALIQEDQRQPLRLGHSFLRIAILRKQDSSQRLVLRLCHALYDGLSFEHIARSIHSLYNGVHLPTPPRFASYIQHMNDSRKDGYKFWRSLLQGSSMTVLQSRRSVAQDSSTNGAWYVESIIKPSFASHAGGITQATIFTTACSRLLANLSGSKDVLFSRLVSGRQYLPLSSQHVVGPCTNIVPVRVHIENDDKLSELLHKVQNQYLDSLPYETLGFEDIKKNCTDWPETTKNYGCCSTYQNFDLHPETQAQDQLFRSEGITQGSQISATEDGDDISNDNSVLRAEPLHDVDMIGVPEPDGVHLRIVVTASRRFHEKETVDYMSKELCKLVLDLSSALRSTVSNGLDHV